MGGLAVLPIFIEHSSWKDVCVLKKEGFDEKLEMRNDGKCCC